MSTRAREATTATAAIAMPCCPARCRVRRTGRRIRAPATATAATWTTRAGMNPQANAIAKVKQIDGRITELARRPATM
jgi:hypothetical protein